jgi:hypothetical protein
MFSWIELDVYVHGACHVGLESFEQIGYEVLSVMACTMRTDGLRVDLYKMELNHAPTSLRDCIC